MRCQECEEKAKKDKKFLKVISSCGVSLLLSMSLIIILVQTQQKEYRQTLGLFTGFGFLIGMIYLIIFNAMYKEED